MFISPSLADAAPPRIRIARTPDADIPLGPERRGGELVHSRFEVLGRPEAEALGGGRDRREHVPDVARPPLARGGGGGGGGRGGTWTKSRLAALAAHALLYELAFDTIW